MSQPLRKPSGPADSSRWLTPGPDRASRLDILKKRHLIMRSVRSYMDGEGFLEIESPLLVRGATPDACIGSFQVEDRFLVSSTEYQIKRMFAGGLERGYTLTKNFRTGDKGSFHNPEFTMLEWARAGVGIDAIENDMEEILCRAHQTLNGGGLLIYQDHAISLSRPWRRMSVAEALDIPDFKPATIERAADDARIALRPQDREDPVFMLTVLLDHAQKNLGLDRPVFLRDWPAFLTSSALEKPGGLADRSELFIAGIELSDGFPFMTGYERQKQTFARELARRKEEGLPPVTLDENYLEALRLGLPPGAGMALGVDRMVMLLLNQPDIRNVLAFAWDEV